MSSKQAIAYEVGGIESLKEAEYIISLEYHLVLDLCTLLLSGSGGRVSLLSHTFLTAPSLSCALIQCLT